MIFPNTGLRDFDPLKLTAQKCSQKIRKVGFIRSISFVFPH